MEPKSLVCTFDLKIKGKPSGSLFFLKSIISIQSIRKSMEGKFNNKIVGNGDFMNYMSYLLTCKGNEDLQMEVAWIFTNMAAASSEYTEMVIKI